MKQTRIWMLLWLAAAVLTLGCSSAGRKGQSKQATELLEVAHKAHHYERLLILADSLEQAGEVSQASANYWRGYASDKLNQKRMAEFYWKSSVTAAETSDDPDEVGFYAKSASRLANLLCLRGDLASAYRMAKPVADRLEALGRDTTSDYVNLLIYLGCSQSSAGESANDADDGFKLAYQKHLENIDKNHSSAAYKNAIAGLINIAYYCNTTGNYQKAIAWIDHFGELIGQYEQLPDADQDYIDKQVARFDIYRARALEGLGKKEDAAKVFEAFCETRFSKTPEGRINANDYLVIADRWNEAADNYRSLNTLLDKQQDPFTIETIKDMLLKKYQANLLAGRRDTALAVSKQICDSLSHALDQASKTEKEELSAIALRAEQFADQQEAPARQHRLWNYAVLALAFLLALAYAVFCRMRVRKEKLHYNTLEKVYTHLGDETAERVDLETRLDVINDIKRTILADTLPQHDALQSHVMRNTVEDAVGGVYDALIRDGKFFCMMADASGQDVWASVVMTATKTQFRTASAFESDPERIVSAINTALAESCITASTVKLFVGVLDLTSGQLQYCSAGHVAPVLVGQDVKQLPTDAQTCELTPGAMLFLFNEGILQVKNNLGKPFGERRLLGEVLQAANTNPAPKPFIESINDALNRYIEGTELSNDVLLLAVRYKG